MSSLRKGSGMSGVNTLTMFLPHIYFPRVTDNTLGHWNGKNSNFAVTAYSPDSLIQI